MHKRLTIIAFVLFGMGDLVLLLQFLHHLPNSVGLSFIGAGYVAQIMDIRLSRKDKLNA